MVNLKYLGINIIAEIQSKTVKMCDWLKRFNSSILNKAYCDSGIPVTSGCTTEISILLFMSPEKKLPKLLLGEIYIVAKPPFFEYINVTSSLILEETRFHPVD